LTSLTFLLVVSLAARPSAVETLDRQGREAFQAGDHAAAAQAFGALLDQLPARDPLRLQTQYNHARALQEAGRACDSVASFEAYLQDPRAAQRKEAKRRAKAQAAFEKAQTQCEAERAAARAAVEAPLIPLVPEVPEVEAPVEPAPAEIDGDFLLLAGLVSGAVFGEATARARTTLGLGAGYGLGRWVGDLEARLSIESPEAEALTAVMLRPGLRWKWREFAYLRAALPVLVAPVTALGVHGGAGVRFPATGWFAGTGEAGLTLWAADPSLAAVEARLGVEALF
jgi:tetratricopeptide (TPR) repeat protein